MNRKTLKLIFILFVAAAIVSSCNAISSKRVGCVCTNIGNEMNCRYKLFSDQETDRIKVESGETLEISYDVEVESGELRISLLNPDEEVVWEKDFMEAASDTATYQANEDGKLILIVEGVDTEGLFNISWQVME